MSGASLAEGDFRKHLPRFAKQAATANAALLAGLTRFAEAKGVASARVALAWLLRKHPHVVPIPGTRQIKYLEQNCAAAALQFSSAELAELDALFPPNAAVGRRYADAGWVGIE